jgi:glutaredoxin-dependent peroxiredoxin
MGLLRDRRDDFEAQGTGVFAVSRDSPYSHVAWAEVLELSFPLLSDWNAEAVDGFGVALPDYRGMKGVARRSAFLIDGEGIVRGRWLYEPTDVPDVDELLTAATELSSGS